MTGNPSTGGDFHATIREVEEGVFRAEYLGELNPQDPDARALPDAHIASSERDVKVWVEEMARGLGYRRVVWHAP